MVVGRSHGTADLPQLPRHRLEQPSRPPPKNLCHHRVARQSPGDRRNPIGTDPIENTRHQIREYVPPARDLSLAGEHIVKCFRVCNFIHPAFEMSQFQEEADSQARIVTGVFVRVAYFEDSFAQVGNRALDLRPANLGIVRKGPRKQAAANVSAQGNIAVEILFGRTAFGSETSRYAAWPVPGRVLSPLASQLLPPGAASR